MQFFMQFMGIHWLISCLQTGDNVSSKGKEYYELSLKIAISSRYPGSP